MRKYFQDEKVFANCHILQMLEEQSKTPHHSFHTPGHKVSGYDITELAYSDNLSCPEGVIAFAEQDIAELLGANKSFLLTDGSTSGVLSMLYALKMHGVSRVAAPMLSHKSFFNGCALLGLEPILFETPVFAVPCPIAAADVAAALEDADALFLTSPDYYGNVSALKEIKALCKAQGKPLVIDGAHGGHLRHYKELYAGAHADMWVDGVHKSLPALTQGAVVSAKKEYAAALKAAVDTFRTSSPSYPIMGSVEYAVKYPANHALAERLTALKRERACFYDSADYTKLCVFCKDGFALERYANEQGIYPEFAQEHLLCFYFSPVQTEEDLLTVLRFVEWADLEGLILSEKDVQRVPAPIKLEKVDGKSVELIPLEGSEGRVCAKACGLFPPCLPVLQKGERITGEKIKTLQAAARRFGIENDKITVVAE
ncbi:MAG: aminotransferase class I/II-fold pyridoxal phosphate-dependent enzyme [Clostridia bacterium]|nr:aminotransferase class I/II-fold pyridoxal phosphate-dependent enzyme [Clostridia bacterium]